MTIVPHNFNLTAHVQGEHFAELAPTECSFRNADRSEKSKCNP